ncbi:seleno O isoform B [Chlorella sorokiniana]|uniref:Selenoprotein O n=1 Tax=Chlorella sorokiniana TaxID=3076 RepID=A0A2P6TU79_CHLSO|nr:seleno O isoform B [Chlorella sorokiniana]|eukprot:PRW57632.1 seleno O isoform B [Chlorella sorokiniana]
MKVAPSRIAVCPPLPVHLWALIAKHAHAQAAADGPVAALKTAATLLTVSHDVAAAVGEVPLRLDFSAASEADLELLRPLADTLSIDTLLLGAQHASGESLLRLPAVAARSGGSLRRLAATVACTDTLQRFSGLQELHLHAGAVEQLYPAVLQGLPSLRHLGLHGYKNVDLEQVLPNVADTLQVLEVTPQPEAMGCSLELRLPPTVRLQRLTVHGSFERILSLFAAPQVRMEASVLVKQCAEVCIEAGMAVWRPAASYCRRSHAAVALARMLLHPDATWRRIELRLLDGTCLQPIEQNPVYIFYDGVRLEHFVEEFNRLGRGEARASLQQSRIGLFDVDTLMLASLSRLPSSHSPGDARFRCDASSEQLMAAGAPSLLFGRTLTTAAAARPVRHLIQRGSTAAASLGARPAPQPWATGAWSAAAARRQPTCPAPAAMSSSSGSGSASAMAAAASPSAAGLAPSTVIDVEPPASSAASTATGASSGSGAGLTTLEELQFDNTFTRELPADDSEVNRPRQVNGAIFSWVTPTPTGTEPTTIACSGAVARMIGLDPQECLRPEFALIFSGNAPLPQSRSYAQCYGGHQFGHWAGQLGDGRAICLGQAVNGEGERWELQLKGAGRTPYSRMADGRAVLRSSIREYIASEAMHALGVPTTRALSLVSTGDQVYRDMFYNGNAKLEPGAVVCRVAKSFIRFGTFQLPATRGPNEVGLVRIVADYVLKHHYPHLLEGAASGGQAYNAYAALLREVAERTARLFAHWHRIGFVHGVLNTDNLSILGDTIDYGPYGFMERFDPDFTPNTTDLPGRRYCFRDQPEIGQWNLVQLARAMILGGLLTEEEAAPALGAYADTLTESYNATMAAKLGLAEYDRGIAGGLMRLMYEDSADYTNTFRCLSSITAEPSSEEAEGGLPPALAEVLGPLDEERTTAWRQWLELYRARLAAEALPHVDRAAMQDSANPAIIPRNHVMVDIIGEAETGNYEPLHRYMRALLSPYSGEGLDPAWLEPAPKQCRLGVELLSCSS